MTKHEAMHGGHQVQSVESIPEDLTVIVGRNNAMFPDVALEVISYRADVFSVADIAEEVGPQAENSKGRVKTNLQIMVDLGVIEELDDKRPNGGRPATVYRRTSKVKHFLAQNPAIERSVRIRSIANALECDDIDAMNFIIKLGEQAVSRPRERTS